MKRLALLMTAAGVVALCAGGCDSSKEQELQYFRKQNQGLTQRVAEFEGQLESVQKTNQGLTQRVAELEGQLKQAEAIVLTAKTDTPPSAADTQPSTGESIYIVVEGDSLWNIAEEQFGNGNLYIEILHLNPQIEEDKPLTIGTKLIMPPQ